MEAIEFHHSKVRLGKAEYKHDERTLMMAKFILPDLQVPDHFDFDLDRSAFPVHMWGNDNYGDCVVAAEANQELRLQRVQTHHTIRLTDEDAITRYKEMTGCREPGDENDTGLEIIVANRDWRNAGFLQSRYGRDYKIDAYGELDPSDHAQLRAACYLLHGIQFGFWLPAAAQEMTRNGVWDYQGQSGGEWRPGSWGGHCVYSKRFDPDSMSVLTWGMEVQVTNAFINKYADEAWAYVDALDPWRSTQTLDVAGLEKQLSQITTKVDQ